MSKKRTPKKKQLTSGGKKAACPPPPPTPPPQDEVASQESQSSRSPGSSSSQASTSRHVSSFISSLHILDSPSREAQKAQDQLRSVDDEKIVIAWVNENECLWNNRMTDYRDTKKKEALWQTKSDEMQYPGKHQRNRFHFSDVHGSMNTMGHVQSKWKN